MAIIIHGRARRLGSDASPPPCPWRSQVDDLRRPGVDEPFAQALRRCMSGDAESRERVVQGGESGDRRRAFGQLYEELSELAFRYYFCIPSYYILVMRSFVTLEGIALSSDSDESFNMYKATAPYARRRLLTPRTAGGRALLRAAVTTRDGRRALRHGLRVPRPRLRGMLRSLRSGDAK